MSSSRVLLTFIKHHIITLRAEQSYIKPGVWRGSRFVGFRASELTDTAPLICLTITGPLLRPDPSPGSFHLKSHSDETHCQLPSAPQWGCTPDSQRKLYSQRRRSLKTGGRTLNFQYLLQQSSSQAQSSEELWQRRKKEVNSSFMAPGWLRSGGLGWRKRRRKLQDDGINLCDVTKYLGRVFYFSELVMEPNTWETHICDLK